MRFSASSGPDSSMAIITAIRMKVTLSELSAMATVIHPTCAMVMAIAYARQADRRSGSWFAARNHWITMAMRITTYPATSTRLLTCSPPAIEANTFGIPKVRTRTPTICSIVVSRYTQSSVSYAEANQLKLIHAQLTEKVANEKPASPAPMWLLTSMCANSDAATPKATTNVRSNSSSNGVAARCGGGGSRPDIRRSRCASTASLWWLPASLTGTLSLHRNHGYPRRSVRSTYAAGQGRDGRRVANRSVAWERTDR